jgi:hypothetical protein
VRGSIPRAYAMTTLCGEEAERLLAELDTGADEAEMQRREARAREYVQALLTSGVPLILSTIADGTSAERTIVHWDKAEHL